MATDVQIGAQRVISRNPATGETLRECEGASAAEVGAAVARARAAQPAWAELGVRARLKILQRFQRLLYQNKDQIARAIARENGKPQVEALVAEVVVVLDAVRFLIENAPVALKPEPVPHGNLIMKTKSAHLVREPFGVIGVISPWNYPFSTPATEGLAALVAGNAVVVKPSEFTPLVALELASLLHEAGVPPDIFQVVVGDGSTGAALLEAPIDKLIFTGSVRTGKRVAETAAKKLLPVVLELGGKDPMLVLDDADLDVATSAAAWGAFMNAGQTCLSVERCYVHRSLCEKFLAMVVEKTGKLRIGNGMDPATDIGPMIHEQQLRVVEGHVEDAIARGARLLTGGRRLPELGPNFYAPTVLADVTHQMQIMREETFGPVLPVMAFATDDEAVHLANDSEFGLAASVWTSNRRRGEALARRIQAGTVMVNDVISCFGISEAPHGGVKSSGLGRAHGRLGLEEMVRVKYVDSDLLPRLAKVWWFGYGEEFARQMEGFVDFLFSSSWMRRIGGGLRSARACFRKRRV
jgi:succinate-semialdehyde dehydrogenase/glutarate-semialdehyde dehydrogenase